LVVSGVTTHRPGGLAVGVQLRIAAALPARGNREQTPPLGTTLEAEPPVGHTLDQVRAAADRETPIDITPISRL
jgi:hypothetical protein